MDVSSTWFWSLRAALRLEEQLVYWSIRQAPLLVQKNALLFFDAEEGWRDVGVVHGHPPVEVPSV